MPFGCTCWDTRTLVAHSREPLVGHDWDEEPARIPPCSRLSTTDMDVLNHLSCGSTSTVSEQLFHCRHQFSSSRGVSSVTISSAPLPSGSISSCSVSTGKEQATFNSRSDRDCVTRRFFGVWPVKLPNRYTRSPRGRATSCTFKPHVMMDEIGKVRIVQDIEMTSIIQLYSLSGDSSKQRVLTQNALNSRDLSLAVDAEDQNTANKRWRDQMPHSRIAARELWNFVFLS